MPDNHATPTIDSCHACQGNTSEKLPLQLISDCAAANSLWGAHLDDAPRLVAAKGLSIRLKWSARGGPVGRFDAAHTVYMPAPTATQTLPLTVRVQNEPHGFDCSADCQRPLPGEAKLYMQQVTRHDHPGARAVSAGYTEQYCKKVQVGEECSKRSILIIRLHAQTSVWSSKPGRHDHGVVDRGAYAARR